MHKKELRPSYNVARITEDVVMKNIKDAYKEKKRQF